MPKNLDLLLSDGILDEVIGRLKSGKEADVFRVLYRGEPIAAKVYKDRQQRAFHNNAEYKEGRKVRNSRTQRAIDKGSNFGRDEAEQAWKSSEVNALQRLHAHGVRVPEPVMFYEGVLLMRLVTDEAGDIAQRLIDAPLRADQARPIYFDMRRQIIGMLCCDLIHGDLSPYNVLLGALGPTIIDFPQTMSAAHNTQAERFFRRDFENILDFLARLDGSLNAQRGDARAIWSAYLRRDLTPDFVPTSSPTPQQRSGGPRQRRDYELWGPAEPTARAEAEQAPEREAQPEAPPPPVSRYKQKQLARLALLAEQRAEPPKAPPPVPRREEPRQAPRPPVPEQRQPRYEAQPQASRSQAKPQREPSYEARPQAKPQRGSSYETRPRGPEAPPQRSPRQRKPVDDYSAEHPWLA